ncbi:MAG: hypothetical protein ACKVH8_23740 [Pirellulales bacterium]
MNQIEISEDLSSIPDSLLQGVTRRAEYLADLTATYLSILDGFQNKPIRLPGNALLEMAAVLEIGLWELSGAIKQLDKKLPTFMEARTAFAARCKKGPDEFIGPQSTRLSRQVLHIWIDSFAWEGSEILDAAIVVDEVDEDQFVKIMADFIWHHKSDLEKLIMEERHDE